MGNAMQHLGRWSSLSGVVFAVLGIAAFGSASGAPGTKASGESVIAFVKAHHAAMQTSDVLWILAFAFLVFFAGTLRTVFRGAPEADSVAAVVLAGAAMFAVGASVYFGTDFVLGADGSHLAPAAAQALNALALTLVLPLCIGGFVFGIASGVAILRTTQLPHWLGWLAVVLGLVAVTPAALGAVFGYLIWAAIVSILVFRRGASYAGASSERDASGD